MRPWSRTRRDLLAVTMSALAGGLLIASACLRAAHGDEAPQSPELPGVNEPLSGSTDRALELEEPRGAFASNRLGADRELLLMVENNLSGAPREIVSLDMNGKVTLGEGVTVDEASRAFYDSLERNFPAFRDRSCTRWDGPLADKLRRDLERNGCLCPTPP